MKQSSTSVQVQLEDTIQFQLYWYSVDTKMDAINILMEARKHSLQRNKGKNNNPRVRPVEL